MIFNEKNEVYTKLGSELGGRFHDAILDVVRDIQGEYAEIPLRELEYVAYNAVQWVFAPELLTKMVRIARAKREAKDVESDS
jgi:hypothetical protein